MTLAASGWTVMHRWSEADGDVLVEELGLGLLLVGLGLGLLLVGLGLGLVLLGLGLGLWLVALGVGLGDGVAEALDDALPLEVGVALGLVTDTAVSWAAHGFVAAGAAAALPISKNPVSPAVKIRNPEIMPNARVATRGLLMDNALVTVVIPSGSPSLPW